MSEYKVGDKVVLDAHHNPQYGTVVDPTTPGPPNSLGASYETCEKVRPDGTNALRWWNRGRMTLSDKPVVELSEADRRILLKAIGHNATEVEIVAARRLLIPMRTQTFTVTVEVPAVYPSVTTEFIAATLESATADDVHIMTTKEN